MLRKSMALQLIPEDYAQWQAFNLSVFSIHARWVLKENDKFLLPIVVHLTS
jgi:hypothetical protein